MSFQTKNWRDYPNTSTPLDADALEDLETRLSGYTDTVAATKQDAAGAATDAELAAHEADTTSVHGISDTADLVTSTGIDAIVTLTQSAYNALTPNSRTLYVISG